MMKLKFSFALQVVVQFLIENLWVWLYVSTIFQQISPAAFKNHIYEKCLMIALTKYVRFRFTFCLNPKENPGNC